MKENIYDRNGIPMLSKSIYNKWLEGCEKAGDIVGTILATKILGIMRYSKILFKRLKEKN